MPFTSSALALVAASLAPLVLADHPLRIDGRRPDTAVITASDTHDRTIPLDTPMGRVAAGVLDRLDARTLNQLLRCARGKPSSAAGMRGPQIAVIHLGRRDSDRIKKVEIVQRDDDTFVARELPPGSGLGVLLDTDCYLELAERFAAYRGGMDPVSLPEPGVSSVMAHPYEPGFIRLGGGVMRQRIYRGMPIRVEDSDRDLDLETMHVRLPPGYDPRRPAGLLVWSSPTPAGRIPQAFAAALDELHFICVGIDDAGNDRDVPDKFQLVFDAVETARRRFHVDDRRIYIAGMSGGGKVSSILSICFPEVFSGAIPIVGYATYTTLDEATWGKMHWPYFAKPQARQLAAARTTRTALMSGPPDFNYKEMVERQKQLESDGFQSIRFFDYPDMAHVMPTPDRFTDALRWVDEPYRQLRAAEAQAAADLLAAYAAGRDDLAPTTDQDRAALNQVIEAGPWTDAAWQALDLLRLDPSAVNETRGD